MSFATFNNLGSTVATQSVSTADGLTVNSVIVPVLKTITYSPIVTDVSKVIFIATEAVQLVAVREVHAVASISGTLQIEKLTSTTAPGGGTTLLTGTVSLSGTANTVATGTLTGTVPSLQLAVGDRIGIVLAGTLTSLVGSLIEIDLKRI